MFELEFLNSVIDVSQWSSGVYLVKVSSANGTQTKRFVKKLFLLFGQKYYATSKFPSSDFSLIEILDSKGNPIAEMIEKLQDEELPIETARNADEESRDIDELQKIIEARLVDISQ